MATWLVSKQVLTIQPHSDPEVERLEVGKAGEYPIVVEKGRYKTGDEVVFVPEKSILPPAFAEAFQPHLVGPDLNRVHHVRLRGELSTGVILGPELLARVGLTVDELPTGQDVSERLGITRYEPPIPQELSGTAMRLANPTYHQHDVLYASIYRDQFVLGEEVLVTEKLHGTQAAFGLDADGTPWLSSKGCLANGIGLCDEPTNLYWTVAKRDHLFEQLAGEWSNADVQVFGELVPVQKGFNYGCTEPTIRFYRVIVEHQELTVDEVPGWLREQWVPILYRGPLDFEVAEALSRGNETVSGRELHVREGVVLSPLTPRRTKDNFPLFVKLLNPRHKQRGDEFN